MGAHFPASAGHVSPQMAQERMQRIMGNNYDFLDNNCHMAQEKLRQAWGLPVHDPYLKTAAICGCGKKLDGIYGYKSVKRLFSKIRKECARLAQKL